jgi:nucleoside-diphosphate-sugar epimerase
MKVVITGGVGFVGLMLARRLVGLSDLAVGKDGRDRVDEVELFDVAIPAQRPRGLDQRVRLTAGDMADRTAVARLIDRPDIGIFHLAAIPSGGGEQDFDLAMQANLTGQLNLLEAARQTGSCPRLAFASTIAVFGGSDMPAEVGDTTKQTPQTTYGMTKAAGELLVNDYSRRGFIDGRSARLPTVIIRPGKPNKAASSFASGVFREPLNGVACELPVGLDTIMPISGYRTIVDGFVRLYEAPGASLGVDRAINFPALAVSVGEMVESLRRVAAGRPLGTISVKRDPVIERIVATWPIKLNFERALKLGLPQDPDLDSIVRAYIADFLAPQQ